MGGAAVALSIFRPFASVQRQYLSQVLLLHLRLNLLPIGHALPAAFDFRFFDLRLHLARGDLLRRFLDSRRNNHKLVAINSIEISAPAALTGVRWNSCLSLKSKVPNRTRGELIHAIQIGSVINHNRIVICDVGDVDGIVNDRDIPGGL